MRPSRLKFTCRFETAPDLISGIELTTNGQKIAWSIADYLASLEKGVDELLKEKNKPEEKAESEPQAQTEPKPQAQTEPKPQAKAEPKLKAAPKTEAKTASKPEEPKPETKHK